MAVSLKVSRKNSMSGPGGASTKRDQRRDTRRAQFQQRQLERQRERQRQIRKQQLRRGALAVGAALVIILLAVFIFNVANGNKTKTPTGLQPASGQAVDGMVCQANETLVYHIHSALQVYIDGAQVTVPEGAGIVGPPGTGGLASNGLTTCLYPLHVHQGAPNLVHIEAPAPRTYTLGNFFDIWGQKLSDTSIMDKPIDATHKLVIQVYDENGKLLKTYDGKPQEFPLADRQTVVMAYNSPPNFKPSLFDWHKA